MEQINFSDVNARMDELFSKNVEDVILSYTETITPPIKKIPTKINIMDVINRIREKFINNNFPENRDIDKKLYGDIASFLLLDQVPLEEKRIVAKYLTEDIKDIVFNEFYERAKETNKGFYVDTEEIAFDNSGNRVENVYFNPRINGVPLKDSENRKLEIKSQRLFEILQSGIMPSDMLEIIAVKSFLESEEFFDMPWCTDKIQGLKEKLNDDKIRESIDTYLKKIDREKIQAIEESKLVTHNINVNKQLKESLISSVPEEFNQLEKSMYLYIKLCQIFSYDDVYYYDSKTPTKGDVSNIADYDSTNNKIVCFEFAYIYSDLLRSIGINHIKERAPLEDRFDNAHANVEFLADNMAIFADSTVSADAGDLLNAKIYGKLNGFRCQLLDKDAQEKFRSSLEKVYRYIKEKDKMAELVPSKEKVSNLNIVDKFRVFNSSVKNCEFTDIDLLSYIQKLKVTIFTERELRDNAYISFTNNQSCDVLFNNASFKILPSNTIGYIIDLHTKKLSSDYIKRSDSEKVADTNLSGEKNSLLKSAIEETERKIKTSEINEEADKIKRLSVQRDNLDIGKFE